MLSTRVIISCMALLNGCVGQQDFLSQFPNCAAKCFESTLTTTQCSPTDTNCLCVDELFLNTAAACNAGNCTVIETLEATNLTYAACGVKIRTQKDTLFGIAMAFGSSAWVMVIVRLMDRGFAAQSTLGWDDLFVGLSGISSLAMTIPALVAARYGFGTDIWGMSPEHITKSLHWLYFAYPFYMTTEAFCQASILFFYLRLMVDHKTLLFVKALLIFVIAFGVANTFAMVFNVWPIRFFWEGWKGEMVKNSGIDMNLFSFVRGGIEIVIDLVILGLPLPMLSKLQMSYKKKVQIMSMFCVGFVITGVSCARLHALIQFSKTQNATYDNTSTIYWCLIEADLFIVVACMPSVYAAFRRMWPRSRNPTNASTRYVGSDKNSYFGGQRSSNPHGTGISKTTEVDIYHTKRAETSDVELVDRHAYLQSFNQK